MASRRSAHFHSRCITLIIVLIGLISAPASAQSIDVLIVHSYSQSYDWVADIDAAIVRHFQEAGITYQFEYMDTKRHPDEASKIASGEKAKALFEKTTPPVVIAVDDNAQAYFAKSFVGKSDSQFIFCGVNADPEHYGYPSTNVTGILERTYVNQSLQLLQMINPSWDAVAWISDDSATAAKVLERLRAKNRAGVLPVPVAAISQPRDFVTWKQTIHTHQKDPRIKAFLIPLYHTVKDGETNQSVEPAKVMQWTTANTDKPIIGLWPFSTQDGALCAVVVDPAEHGRMAALMAKEVLSGKSAAYQPMIINRNGFVVINLKRASELKIEIPFEILQTADQIIE